MSHPGPASLWWSGLPPDTGASIKLTPFPVAMPATSFEVSDSRVLESMSRLPGCTELYEGVRDNTT